MAKSTFQDAHAVYRQTRTLSRAHKQVLIYWLQEDVAEKPAKMSKKKLATPAGGGQT